MRARCVSRPIALVVAIAIAHVSAPARAEDKAACRDAFAKGQSLRDDGKLSAARERFAQCTQVCPTAFQKQCETWLSELDASQPTIVLRAVDGGGQDLASTTVTLDGNKLIDVLDGRSIAVDPGSHTIVFAVAERAPITKTIVVAMGEKNRIVLAEFPSSSPPARDAASSPPAEASHDTSTKSGAPIAAYVLGGVGVTLLAGFAYFGLKGNAQHDDLVNGCSKTASCAQSDKDAVTTSWHIADALLATGVVAIGIGAYLFLFSNATHDGRGPTTSVGVRATQGGGRAELRIDF